IFAYATASDSAIQPQRGVYGYFVDTYMNNSTANKTPETNPSIGLLIGMSDLWAPGTSIENGTVLNREILEENYKKVKAIVENRTQDEAKRAYLDDRRHQSYSMIDGFGRFTDIFKQFANAGTTIPDEIPADAVTVKYEDKGNSKGNWADKDSALGKVVELVDTVRYPATTTPSKIYYLTPRPWRPNVIGLSNVLSEDYVLPTLVPCKSTSATDADYPSGHANAAMLASYALAYAYPERFAEIITRGSELGYDRIVAGMHSPLGVMGARMTSTAFAASVLNNPANENLKAEAYKQIHDVFAQQNANASSIDRFDNYAENRANYIKRLTYGFKQIGDTTKAMVVPKGAEVLLETRLPYLDAAQRRWVLYTTGIASGYPIIDDAEGWGRLDLFSASYGYGAFVNDVAVTMDASKGGFNALDNWRNDISGSGKLTKLGTGTLILSGNNTYSGGTQVDGGTLVAASSTAFGTGAVVNNGGTISSKASGLTFKNGFTQSSNGTLELTLSGKKDVLTIKGNASLGGTLKLNFENGYIPADGDVIIDCDAISSGTKFSSVVATGLASNYKVAAAYVYADGNIKLNVENSSQAYSDSSSDSSSGSSVNTSTTAHIDDSANGISIINTSAVLPVNAQMTVSPVNVPAQNGETLYAFDISLQSNGVKLTKLDGKVTVRLPLPADIASNANIAVYYIDDKGNRTNMNATVSGKYVEFQTDHFSIYAISVLPAGTVRTDAPKGNPKTGCSSNTATLSAVLACVGLAAVSKRAVRHLTNNK
ncbi:MAG TPA: hypothetical protein DCP97_04065, partial [Ruminococcaceae bacterium]|nr:hypothetical protein [Oscillospiraceae bacterium]